MAKTLESERQGSADSLARAAGKLTEKGPAPVHLWNPPFCGDIDMRIARDGTWFYLGTPIGRPAMVRLFSGILKREGDRYFLVTPAEKVGIIVDDVPFVAMDADLVGGQIVFVTHVGEKVAAGPGHDLRVETDPETGEPAPYVHVRGDLWARIDRKTFYRLVEMGEVRDGMFGLRSGERFYPLARASDLDLGEDDA